jgi:hypothetical protein
LAALLVQRGLQALEEAHVVADRGGFVAGGTEGEPSGARQTSDRQPEG